MFILNGGFDGGMGMGPLRINVSRDATPFPHKVKNFFPPTSMFFSYPLEKKTKKKQKTNDF